MAAKEAAGGGRAGPAPLCEWRKFDNQGIERREKPKLKTKEEFAKTTAWFQAVSTRKKDWICYMKTGLFPHA